MDTLPVGAGNAALPTIHHTDLPGVPPSTGRLDRAALRQGIARRREALAELEASLVADCEAAAAHGRSTAVDTADRATWDRGMWERYLAPAVRFEPHYGPRMQTLLRDIERLSRLADLPVAA